MSDNSTGELQIKKTLKKWSTWSRAAYGKATLRTLYVFVAAMCLPFIAQVLPSNIFNPTTTISAKTESIRLQTVAGRDSSWVLTEGKYSVPGGAKSKYCAIEQYESVCTFEMNTLLVIKGEASITIQISPTGGMLVTAEGVGDKPLTALVYGSDDELLLQSDQVLTYQSDNPRQTIKIPLVARSAVVGANFHEHATVDNSAFDFWQPALSSGDVLAIARNWPGREKYQLVNERLDAGDIVRLGASDDIESKDNAGAIWGIVTVELERELGGRAALVRDAVIHVVLHTSLREISVTRFGAPEGHIIKASRWVILSNWPNGQIFWILFVSIILILTFWLQLAESISSDIGTKNLNNNEELSTTDNADLED